MQLYLSPYVCVVMEVMVVLLSVEKGLNLGERRRRERSLAG